MNNKKKKTTQANGTLGEKNSKKKVIAKGVRKFSSHTIPK